MFAAKEYRENLRKFHTLDGAKAILLYGIYILVLWLQGLACTTNFSVDTLNKLQIAFPLLLLMIGMAFLVGSREKLCTVGLHTTKLVQSLLWGAALALCLLIGMAVCSRASGNTSIRITAPMFSALGLFAIGALQEEIIFRGYIQTRLTGLVKRPLACSFCTAFLFLAMHYPVRWVVGGVSWNALSLSYVIVLIVLHFVCDFVYKRTNCLWGAILLHFLYNMGQSMLVL